MNHLEFIKNEIGIDLFWRDKLKINDKGINYRPFKYKRLNSSRFCYYLLMIGWRLPLVTLNLLFFLISLLKSTKEINTLKEKSIWLESSFKSTLIRERNQIENMIIIDLRKQAYLNYLDRRYRTRCFIKSLKTISFDLSSVSFSNKLQYLDIYRLICFHEFVVQINRLALSLHLTSHYDRWTMAASHAFTKGIEIWQHGLLSDQFKLDQKLGNVVRINYLREQDVIWWQNNICSASCDFKEQHQQLQFTEQLESIDVLMISNPGYVKEEFYFLKELMKLPQFLNKNIAYKPHPLYSNLKYKRTINSLKRLGVFIMEPKQFPKVTLVIHNGSTLGYEYETMGINVIDYSFISVSVLADKFASQKIFV